MRALSNQEKTLLIQMSERLCGVEKDNLLRDIYLANAREIDANACRIVFDLDGYQRSIYQGQHQYGVEGRMLNGDNTDISICLYADDNGRLLELEFVCWNPDNIFNPKWETLQIY